MNLKSIKVKGDQPGALITDVSADIGDVKQLSNYDVFSLLDKILKAKNQLGTRLFLLNSAFEQLMDEFRRRELKKREAK